jgi:hypothetical protein
VFARQLAPCGRPLRNSPHRWAVNAQTPPGANSAITSVSWNDGSPWPHRWLRLGCRARRS